MRLDLVLVYINGKLLEEVECFKYLGSHVALRERAWNRGNVGCKEVGALNGLMKIRTRSMKGKRVCIRR